MQICKSYISVRGGTSEGFEKDESVKQLYYIPVHTCIAYYRYILRPISKPQHFIRNSPQQVVWAMKASKGSVVVFMIMFRCIRLLGETRAKLGKVMIFPRFSVCFRSSFSHLASLDISRFPTRLFNRLSM